MKLNKFLSAIFFTAVMVFQFSCQKDYSVEGIVLSKGSLITDAASNCIGFANGSYNVGAALTSDNYILDSVNVTSPGGYVVITDTVNGIWFKATGKFSNTGRFLVQLKGYGTPLTTGTFNYTLTYDSTSCPVSVFTDVATGGGTPNTDYYFKATIGGTSIDFSDSVSSARHVSTLNGKDTTTLTLYGINKATAATFVITLMKPSKSITTGSYTNTSTAANASCIYTDISAIAYIDYVSYPFTVNISSVVTSSNITGTFNGTLVTGSSVVQGGGGALTTTVNVTNGTFNLPFK